MTRGSVPDFAHTRSSSQHYELIPQTTLSAAEASLRDEIAPSVATLLDRADRQVERLERRVETLKARTDLQQGRLTTDASSGAPASSAGGGGVGKTKKAGATAAQKGAGAGAAAAHRGGGRPLDAGARLRAKMLRQRREALQYSVERMELEALHKERELRKRLDKADAQAAL